MKIVADQNIPFVKEAYSDFGEVVAVSGRSIDRKIIADADMLLVRSVTPVTAELLAGSSIKFVATATIGIEHIDRACLEKNGIGFAYAPCSNAASVAEYVIAAILLMAKKAGRRPSDMVLGIIGVGNIGSRLQVCAETMGMRCLLNDPPKKRMLKSGGDLYRPIEEVLGRSDIVSLHVPLETGGSNPTYHLVDDAFLQRMKQGAVLINTSRGKIMNDDSLKKYHAKLGGLVFDVWNNEPHIDPALCALADIATPHIAGYSFDGKINGAVMIYQSACAFFRMLPRWNYREILQEKGGMIDCAGCPEPVYDAILKTVPILRDSSFLKKTVFIAAEERGTCFETLRTTYPKRLEFTHFSVACDKSREQEAAILSKLGFEVVIK